MSTPVLPTDERYARIARSHGMQNSLRALAEARAVQPSIRASLALALLTQETTNGSNVWGHDRAPNGNTTHLGGHVVQERDYRAYLRIRGHRGMGGMQGVGPAQLTYFDKQDRADRLGGCWKPKHSLRVAFTDLALLIRLHGERKALAIYNGGPTHPNFAYADSVLAHAHTWHARLTA